MAVKQLLVGENQRQREIEGSLMNPLWTNAGRVFEVRDDNTIELAQPAGNLTAGH